MVEIFPVGGLGEIGRNMTAISFGKECIIVDMGIRLDTLLSFEEIEIGTLPKEELMGMNIIPDDRALKGRKVRGVIISHAHLDHIGAVTKLAGSYRAPIIATPFTLEILKRLKSEEQVYNLNNRLIPMKPNKKLRLGKIEVSFIHATHSVPQTVLVLLRRGEKQVLYASDFKFDPEPVLGPPADYASLRRLGQVQVALVGTVRLDEHGPIPSERWVASRLGEVMKEAHEHGGAVIVTTFSSHLARLKSIIDISLKLGRLPVVVGRSLWNYMSAGMRLKILKLPEEVKIGKGIGRSKNLLRMVNRNREDYLLICTGHQGEPNSVLTLVADDKLPFKLEKGDSVIFSSSVIPNPITQGNRELLETKLQLKGVRVYKDVHASGHAGRQETMEFLRLVNPEHVFPCHGTGDRLRIMYELARGLGYSPSQIHLTENGIPVELD